MKLWYQSVTRNGRFPAYNAVLRKVINRAKDPSTEVEIHGIERQGGTGDQYRYLAFLQSVEILENVHRAIEEGFDAFLIGNIGNPGLLEAREIAEFPVLGLGETSINVMRTMGESFGLITINEKYRPRLLDVVRDADAERRLAGMYPMDFSAHIRFGGSLSGRSKSNELIRRFRRPAPPQAATAPKCCWRRAVSLWLFWPTAALIRQRTARRSSMGSQH